MSVTFCDGPARGVRLDLARCPILLRVVFSDRRSEPWDALDRSQDTPRNCETIHLYRRCAPVTTMHVSARPRSASGWFKCAAYRVYSGAWPSDATMRDTHRWQEWCRRLQACGYLENQKSYELASVQLVLRSSIEPALTINAHRNPKSREGEQRGLFV
ncbi:MAG: hypothetical protein AAGE65_13640 [Planctomycetota bacterium]